MSAQIPDSHRDLLNPPTYVTVATLNPDEQPQLSVIWCKTDGDDVLFSITTERQKAENLAERPKATILSIDPQNPFRYVEVRGKVTMTKEGGLDLINELAQAYRGVDRYYGGVAPAEQEAKETRVVCRLTPSRVRPFPPQS
jgi:PPOX class probable F420-dependent enzyme